MNDNMTEVITNDKVIVIGEDNFNIQLKSSNVDVDHFKLTAQDCWATPSNVKNDSVNYEFIKASCPADGETFTENNGSILLYD